MAAVTSDHGSLSGLTDDDHTDYLNTVRHDADDHSSFDFATMGSGLLPTARGGFGFAPGFYDSGWFAIAASTDYTKTHNLGTVKCILTVYWASDSNGAEMQAVDMANSNISSEFLIAHKLTTTTVNIAAGASLSHINDDGTRVTAATSGYARVIMLALE